MTQINATVSSPHRLSMRDARRVDVKYPAAGPGKTLRDRWDADRTKTRNAMKKAGLKLVRMKHCPTLPKVQAEMKAAGILISLATINRNSDALHEVRSEWERQEGRVPQWNRAQGDTAATMTRSGPANSSCENEIDLAERRLARARSELADAKATIDELRAETAVLNEQIRRLELGLTRER